MALTKAQQAVVTDKASRLDIPAAFALGIVDKESAGKAFYTVGTEKLPAIRIEGHYFWRLLGAGSKRDQAVAQGLAAKSSGVVKNPSTMAGRYIQLQQMEAIDRETASQSISIGIGQVMGEHYKRIGYTSAVAMLQAATASFDNQVAQFLSFIATDAKLLKAARDYDYVTFARIYNGRNYKQNRYDTELKAFVEKWLGYGSIEVGANAPAVDYKARVNALGYDTVKAFQTAKGLASDGIAGPITREAIVAAEKAAKERNNKAIVNAGKTAAGAVVVGAGTVAVENADSIGNAVDTIEAAKPAIEAIQTASNYGTTVIIVVVVGIVLVAGFIAVKQYFKNREVKNAGLP